MHRFLTVVFACALGHGAAFSFSFVSAIVRPCTGEGLACSMTSIVALIYIPVFGAVGLLAFAVATLWRNDARALAVAALVPLIPFLLLVAYIKWSEIFAREFHEIRERDIQELLQIVVPIVLTLVVPWIVLRCFTARAETEVQAHG